MLSLLKFIYLFLFLKIFGSHAVSYHCVHGPQAFSQVERITALWRFWPVLAMVPFLWHAQSTIVLGDQASVNMQEMALMQVGRGTRKG